MEMTFHIIHAAYAMGLIYFLSRTGPSLDELPAVDPAILPKRKAGAWIQAIIVALVFLLSAGSEDGLDILVLFLQVTVIWVLVAWWRRIRLRWVIQGVILGLAAFLAGIPARENGLVSETVFILFPSLVPFFYVAGGLLIDRTRFGEIRLRNEGPRKALGSFLWGCLLFLPMGIFNVADGPVAGDLSWVTGWWMPLSLPWFSGIAEEALFRLFLMGICFFLLRPVFPTRPLLAVVATVLFSAVVFGLAHGWNPETLLTTGFLYGAPMAVVFARRDFEHAVGAHYMINMPSWVVAFLGA
jgi:hypothetical protein